MERLLRTLIVIATATTLAACDNDSSDDGQQRPLLAAVHSAPDMRTITFLREEEVWSALEFGTGTDFRAVDADQYDVNFDSSLPGDETLACGGDDGDDVKDDDECTRLTSTSINVIADHEYVVALLGRYGNLRVQVYDKLVHEFDTSNDDGDPDDETTEVQFFHWSDDLPELDVYLERPGTNLSPVQARATLTSGAEFHAVVADGDYVITLSPVGNPASPVFTSETFALQERTRVAFAIHSGAGDGTSTIKVERFRDQAGTLLDRRVTTQLRIANVASDTGNVDIYGDEDFTQPFAANLAVDSASPYATVPSSSLTDFELDATPAGNPGVLLAREEVDLARGERATFFLFGSTGRLDGLRVQDSFRRIATHARLRMINTAAVGLDFFVVPSGSNINTLSPTISLSATSASSLLFFEPKAYDILLTKAGTDDVVFGPLPVNLAGNGIYTVVATATGDATAADVVLFDDPAN